MEDKEEEEAALNLDRYSLNMADLRKEARLPVGADASPIGPTGAAALATVASVCVHRGIR